MAPVITRDPCSHFLFSSVVLLAPPRGPRGLHRCQSSGPYSQQWEPEAEGGRLVPSKKHPFQDTPSLTPCCPEPGYVTTPGHKETGNTICQPRSGSVTREQREDGYFASTSHACLRVWKPQERAHLQLTAESKALGLLPPPGRDEVGALPLHLFVGSVSCAQAPCPSISCPCPTTGL